MSVISKETKVGALTAIAITILVLGYNYLSGKDDLFYTGKNYHVVYDNVDGLTTSNPVMFRGVRIGVVSEVNLDIKSLQTYVELEITRRGFKVPVHSVAKIYDVDLFGAKGVEILLSDSTLMAEHGDTLLGDKDISLTESLSLVLNPLANKVSSILTTLDSLTGDGRLEESLDQLPGTINSLKKTLDNTTGIIASTTPKLESILLNVDQLVTSLNSNKESLTKAMDNLESITDDVAKTNLKETVDNANKALAQFSTTLEYINSGKGSLGLLMKDDELYVNLAKATKDLDILIMDMNKHPDKYLAIPFTKRRQKKAMKKSAEEDYQKD
jgi:phospholipid/cholesterol/gamma-HCH transport system substrate-binding protein